MNIGLCSRSMELIGMSGISFKRGTLTEFFLTMYISTYLKPPVETGGYCQATLNRVGRNTDYNKVLSY